MERKKCLFCESTNLTKEHYYTKWFKKENLSTNGQKYRTVYTDKSEFDFHPDIGLIVKNKTNIDRRTGDTLSNSLKVVCKDCNSGWMGNLQTNFRKIFNKFKDGKVDFDRKEKEILSAWATMFSIVVGEHHPRLIFNSKYSNEEFKKTQLPPSGWSIWMGRYTGGILCGTNHFGQQLIELNTDTNSPKINSFGRQSTSMNLGEIFFVCTYSNLTESYCARVGNFDLLRFSDPPLNPIWPIRDNIRFKNILVNDLEADLFSRFPLKVSLEGHRLNWFLS